MPRGESKVPVRLEWEDGRQAEKGSEGLVYTSYPYAVVSIPQAAYRFEALGLSNHEPRLHEGTRAISGGKGLSRSPHSE